MSFKRLKVEPHRNYKGHSCVLDKTFRLICIMIKVKKHCAACTSIFEWPKPIFLTKSPLEKGGGHK